MTTIPGYQQIPVKTWFLTFEGAMPDISPSESIHLKQWKNPDAGDYLQLYKDVGHAWGWSGRLLKSPEELTTLLNSENNEIWLFSVDNEIAGFFELDRSENETEIVYLGLKPEWIGMGLGQRLILASVSIAGQHGENVWLHTCEKDHPAALKAYLKAGFTIKKVTESFEFYPES